MRKLYTIVFLLLTMLSYCQKSTLLQNVNIRAEELKHSLNKTGDSLILEAERTIYRVEIFNRDFEKSLMVKDYKIKIPLRDIPVGRFVIEAVMPDRLIVITLLRNEIIDHPTNAPRTPRKVSLFGDTTLASNEKPTSEPKINTTEPKLAEVSDTKKATTKEEVAITKKEPVVKANNSVSSTIAKPTIVDIESTVIELKRPANPSQLSSSQQLQGNSGPRIVQAYWIVYQTNNRHSSGREMRFGDEALVDKMIAHINLDKRTHAGKDNELTVWEIYDVSAFLRYKMRNPNDYTQVVDCFNAVPYFKSSRDTALNEPKP